MMWVIGDVNIEMAKNVVLAFYGGVVTFNSSFSTEFRNDFFYFVVVGVFRLGVYMSAYENSLISSGISSLWVRLVGFITLHFFWPIFS